MTRWLDYRAKLIEIAEGLARDGAQDEVDFLRRFRVVYQQLITSVDGSATMLGFGPYGPMPTEFPGMRPDVPKLLSESDEALEKL